MKQTRALLSMDIKEILPPVIGIMMVFILGACSNTSRSNSPDVKYKSAVEYNKLKLPSTTSNERNSLYIVPASKVGTDGKNISSNASHAIFLGSKDHSRLAMQISTKELWPMLEKFVQSEGRVLELNDEQSGLLVAQWDVPLADVPDTNIVKNMIKGKAENDGALERIVIRVQQDNKVSNIYAKHQFSVDASEAQSPWVLDEQSPERTKMLFKRMLLSFGVSETRVQEIIQ